MAGGELPASPKPLSPPGGELKGKLDRERIPKVSPEKQEVKGYSVVNVQKRQYTIP